MNRPSILTSNFNEISLKNRFSSPRISRIAFDLNDLDRGIRVALHMGRLTWVGPGLERMAFRIQKSVSEDTVTFSVSGRLGAEGIAELKRLLEGHPERHRLVLDLGEVGLVERIAIRSLTALDGSGVRLVNCPAYVRDWILGGI